MPTGRLVDEQLPKRLAFPIFSSDALSSVAYATEAALIVLVGASLAARSKLPWISFAVAGLLVIVVASYRQTIRAYPNGGGAYVVASENLGPVAGLVAAASLLVDYTLTVAVSIAAGVLAITSVAASVDRYVPEVALGVLVVLVVANLRGLRESGRLFALPTYVFLVSVGACLAVGITRGLVAGWPAANTPNAIPTGTGAAVGIVVVLRAFASGASALTGVEAIANGVTAFRRPQARNAVATITIMGTAAVVAFVGVSLLAWKTGALPSQSISILAQVAHASFGTGTLGDLSFYVLQASTFAVLILAANTAFQGFPRLAALLARDGFAPRQLQNLGDRLVLSNGIVLLGVAAAVLLIVSSAEVDQLIHLYLLGVFTAFTLSQVGMVRMWLGRRRVGATTGSLAGLALNGVGAAATGAVALLVVATKFTQGAWMVVVAVPILVIAAITIGRHYRTVDSILAPDLVAESTGGALPARMLVLIHNGENPATQLALRYARAVAPGGVESLRIVETGNAPSAPTGDDPGIPREIAAGEDPTGALVAHLEQATQDGQPVTLVVPEWFEHPSLLSAVGPRSAFALKVRLLGRAGVVVTDVPLVAGRRSVPVSGPLTIRTVVLVAEVSERTVRAVSYARAIDPDARAVHISLDGQESRLLADWEGAGLPLELEVVPAPYRDLAGPLLEVVRRLTREPTVICNVVLAEVIPTRIWQRPLHNQRSLFIKRVLLFEPQTVVTSVPSRIQSSARDSA